MSHPPRRDHLRVIRPNHVGESISMLCDLSDESLLSYLMMAAAAAQLEGKLSEIQRARITRLISRLIKEIDKAA